MLSYTSTSRRSTALTVNNVQAQYKHGPDPHRGRTQITDLESAYFSPPVLCAQPYTVWEHQKRDNRPFLGPTEAVSHPPPSSRNLATVEPQPVLTNNPSPGKPTADLVPNSKEAEALSKLRSPFKQVKVGQTAGGGVCVKSKKSEVCVVVEVYLHC